MTNLTNLTKLRLKLVKLVNFAISFFYNLGLFFLPSATAFSISIIYYVYNI